MYVLSIFIFGNLSSQPLNPNKAFKRGEVLTYRVHYGLIDAGEATIAIAKDSIKFNNSPCYHVVGTGNSKNAFDWFFKVRDRYDSYIDEQTLLPKFFMRRVNEGGFIINQDYRFNQTAKSVNVKRTGTDEPRNTPGKVFTIPSATHDILSAFYYARNLNLDGVKIGDIITIQTWLKGLPPITIITHFNPDGDAIGSSIALKLYLEKQGLKVDCIFPSAFPSYYNWIPYI